MWFQTNYGIKMRILYFYLTLVLKQIVLLDYYLSSESGHHDWNEGPWKGLKVDDINSPKFETNLKNSTIIYVSERIGYSKK